MGPLITATSAILVAIIGGVITLLQARKKQATDAQASLQSGFNLLITKLQEERVVLTGKIEDLSKENAEQSREINILQRTVTKLETKLDTVLTRWRAGEDPPPEEETRRGNQ